MSRAVIVPQRLSGPAMALWTRNMYRDIRDACGVDPASLSRRGDEVAITWPDGVVQRMSASAITAVAKERRAGNGPTRQRPGREARSPIGAGLAALRRHARRQAVAARMSAELHDAKRAARLRGCA